MTPKYTKRTDKTLYCVVHCADTPPSADIGVAEIRKWHTEERGWIDCGYHKVIRRNGTIEDGRPLWAVGAHVEGFNHNSVAVCLVGGKAEKGGWEDNFTPEQLASLAKVIRAIRLMYPGAIVRGHRDFPGVTKLCPSFDVRSWWATVNLVKK